MIVEVSNAPRQNTTTSDRLLLMPLPNGSSPCVILSEMSGKMTTKPSASAGFK
ncbi:MAG: hypothetical protein V9H25_09230 [Candidatus Competibacter sp.]